MNPKSPSLPRTVVLHPRNTRKPGRCSPIQVELVEVVPGWAIVNHSVQGIRLEWIPVERIEKLGDPD